MQNSLADRAGKSPPSQQRGAGEFQPAFLGLPPGSVMQEKPHSPNLKLGFRTPGSKI
jgi:hypothetical protein